MGKLIDADEYQKEMFRIFSCNDSDDRNIRRAVELGIASAPPVEAIPKADYEARLKADMVAMLEDIDLKIDEMYEPQFSKEGMDGFYWAQGLFKDLVQEEINALKGEEDGCNN